MGDKKTKRYQLLSQEEMRKWIGLIMKVNQGFELDDKELEKLGYGFMIFDRTNIPGDIKNKIKKAEDYYKLNITEK